MKNFYLRPSHLVMYACAALVMAAAGVAKVLGSRGVGVELGVAAVLVGVIVWSLRKPIVRLEDDHIVIKVAPAAKKHLVLYRDILGLESKGKKRVFVRACDGERERRIRLPVSLLSEADGEAVLTALQNRIG